MGVPVTAAKLTELRSADVIALPLSAEPSLGFAAEVGAKVAGVDVPSGVTAAWAKKVQFTAGAGEVFALRQLDGPTLLLIGVGAGDDEGWRKFGAAAVRAASPKNTVGLVVPAGNAAAQEAASLGAMLATYRFNTHKSTKAETVAKIVVASSLKTGLDASLRAASATAEAVAFAKDLINEPPGHLSPTEMAKRAAATLKTSGARTKVEVWEKARIERERLGGLLGVAQGSIEPPRLVKATYTPAKTTTKTPHIVLVGKGVTFDSGGLSLKPAASMMRMKTDMSGAAIVLGVVAACEALGITVKVTAFAPMTENMPSGTAIRPSDVLTARNGKTMEVLNTDAEGRLILADALCLGAELKPTAMIDVATLTGAQVVALGDIAAAYATTKELSDALFAAGEREGEHNWPMPLPAQFRSHIDSDIADMKNIGKTGEAGSISAALFLKEFVGDTQWAHLDIAGPSDAAGDSGYLTRGGTAFSLRTILRYLREL
jgi:leucyl aminopeptidase